MTEDNYREISDKERSILLKLTTAGIQDADILVKQIESANVCLIDNVGSLKFQLSECPRYADLSGPLITAQQHDVDTVPGFGPFINVLLFLKNGYIDELEIYKDDGSEIVERLDPEKFFLTWGMPVKR